MNSPAIRFLANFVGRPDPHGDLDRILDTCTTIELAALAYDYHAFWARPEQLYPATQWRSAGILSGIGFGKTWTNTSYVIAEAMSGRAMRIGACAQNEDEAWAVLVHGQSGFLAMSPPWFMPKVEGREVVWPNGARCRIYTPHEPQNIRGQEHHLFLASELAAWPRATGEEAFGNILARTRLGYGRLVWDTTPKQKNPLVRTLLSRAADDPANHIVVRGKSEANRLHQSPGWVEEMRRVYGNTRKAREELDGEFIDDVEGAMFQQPWIDRARREAPLRLRRRIITIDPSQSVHRGSDRMGMVDLGLGNDGQVYVFGDYSGRIAVSEWARRAIDLYCDHHCDLIIAERNRGGDMVEEVLRGECDRRRLRLERVHDKQAPHHSNGTVWFKDTNSRAAKEIRAEPVAHEYELGRISHVIGADLASLEESMTTWEPAPGISPDDVDALCQGVRELLALNEAERVDHAGQVRAAQAAAKRLVPRSPAPQSVLGVKQRRERWGRAL